MRETIYDILSKTEDLSKQGCILLDAGVYFPYLNQEIVTFDAALVYEPQESNYYGDKKYNHRYLNHGYKTISKTYGRKVCSKGYPIVGPVSELNKYKYLAIKLGINANYITMYIPVHIQLDDNKPYTYLTVHANMDEPNEPTFTIDTYKSGSIKDGWYQNLYASRKENVLLSNERTVLEPDVKTSTKYSYTIVYKTPIELNGMSWEDAVPCV